MKENPDGNDVHILKRSWGLRAERPIEILHQTGMHDDRARHYDMHYELEMGIVLEGFMERYTRDSRRVCHAGEMWFAGVWEPHGFRCDGNCERVVFVLWPPSLSDLRFPEAPGLHLMQPFLLPRDLRPVIPAELRQQLIDIARHHLASVRHASPARRRLFATELLVWLFDQQLVDALVDDASQERMSGIAPAIERVFSSTQLLTNAEAARTCGLSRDVFIRSFQRHMGISFSKFALRHRLSRAAAALRETDEPIKAIAYEWGFTDESHLHRLFKQHYDCTPLAYRDSRRQ